MSAEVTIVNNWAPMFAALQEAIGDKLGHLADAVAVELRAEMDGPHSGARYGSHQASAPGETPANWHGDLRASIQSARLGPLEAEYRIGSTQTQYFADYLEYGSPGGMIAPRPIMHPSVEIAGPELVEHVTETVQEVLK